jgi:hypothetical protein
MRTRNRERELKRLSKYPLGSDRLGWYKHYAERFNKTQHPDAAHLAMWYLLLHLALGEEK